MKILAIESSCDETAASLIEGKNHHLKILTNVVASQASIHAAYGGVVPEVASRTHLEKIALVVKRALKISSPDSPKKLKEKLASIDAMAVTIGPGLIGSLLVGVNFAKALAYALKKPIIPINHLEGHLYAGFISPSKNSKDKMALIKFPLLGLLVSGGHTALILMKDHLQYKILGQSLDDAAGECLDKGGKLLGLSYPAGPQIEKLAQKGNPTAFDFPKPMLNSKDLNFSFSGLKTAFLYQIKKLKKLDWPTKANLAASLQKTVFETLTFKTLQAIQKYQPQTFILTGGVAANTFLRQTLKTKVQKFNPSLNFIVPPKSLCTDNAAMVGAAAYFKAQKEGLAIFEDWKKINPYANLKL